MLQCLKDGKIIYREDLVECLANAGESSIGLLESLSCLSVITHFN